MRRKIDLYIGGKRADLSDQSLILWNYSQTDLQKPTVVKNAYSKQITLPGTPANDAIFGGAWRVDRIAGSGFNPLERTPFTIYDEKGTILEAGYAKLDKVTRSSGSRSYAVTLYGGLGSFFYALSYSEDGEKKSLADLYYKGNAGYYPLPAFDDELDITMSGAYVRNAWSLIDNSEAPWHITPKIINFAPCYEGVPEGDFDAQKAVALLANIGLPATQVDGDVTYAGRNDATIINLAEAIGEWTAKDLRCYLQRPILKVSALLRALEVSDYNGGFTFDHSAVDADVADLWLTLPLLSSLQSISQESRTYQLALSTVAGTGSRAANLTLPSTALVAPLSGETVRASFRADFSTPDALHLWSLGDTEPYDPNTGYYREHRAIWFAQVVALSPEGYIVGGSPVLTYYMATSNPQASETLASVAALCGYTPAFADAGFDGSISFDRDDNVLAHLTFGTEFECRGAVSFYVDLRCYMLVDRYMQNSPAIAAVQIDGGGRRPYWVRYETDAATQQRTYYHQQSNSFAFSYAEDTAHDVVVVSPSQARSGATLKKVDLLSTEHTPAEYLLSLAKTFGWYFLTDREAKTITVLPRNAFYGTGLDTIDLSGRIDRSRGLEITPAYAGSKWYDLSFQDGVGAFYDDYLKRYGVRYGIQRVNTGYDFDSQPEELMSDVVLREAVSTLDYGRYWNIITDGSKTVPSVFLDSGHTYTLWAPDGSTKDFSVSRPSSSASIEYYNAAHPGYDIADAAKLEFKDAEGKAVDGADVLVRFNGKKTYKGYKVTDDSTLMLLLNDGVPCWDFTPASGTLGLPIFSRLEIEDGEAVSALEFGDVRELAVPDVTLGGSSSLYYRKWREYLRDLLDEDTKVLKCRVNLEGLDVGPQLLRRFFWYEGSLWVLNKINNYSLTTYDTAECEFVQVRNIENYTNGQQ